jgi:hypothetical protein
MKGLLFLSVAVVVFLSACDPFALDTPRNLSASLSGNTVTLTWSSVTGATRYHVFGKMSGYFSTSGQFLEKTANPTSPSYTESLGSANGTTYTWQVVAENQTTGKYSSRATSNSIIH